MHKSYGDLPIMKGFDYTFKRGERIGVVGKNGVGKSTFLKIALQLEKPDSGKINHGERWYLEILARMACNIKKTNEPLNM